MKLTKTTPENDVTQVWASKAHLNRPDGMRKAISNELKTYVNIHVFDARKICKSHGGFFVPATAVSLSTYFVRFGVCCSFQPQLRCQLQLQELNATD